MASTLRKYNTDLYELCYWYLRITTSYTQTPLRFGARFSPCLQPHNFLEKSLLCAVAATYSKAHPALLGEQQQRNKKEDNLSLKLSPDFDASWLYWHVCTALRFYFIFPDDSPLSFVTRHSRPLLGYTPAWRGQACMWDVNLGML